MNLSDWRNVYSYVQTLRQQLNKEALKNLKFQITKKYATINLKTFTTDV